MNLAHNKNIYLNLVNKLPLPIFFQPWWLDQVCIKGKWNVCISYNKVGFVTGVLTYYNSLYFGLKIIRTPPFTPYLGIWLNLSDFPEKNAKRYSFETHVIGQLIDMLPKVIWYHQIHPEQLQNWKPFYWLGYQQSTRYTYVFENIGIDEIFAGMKGDVRNKIRKAERSGLKVVKNNDLDTFLTIHQKTFVRQNISLQKQLHIFKKLHTVIHQKRQGSIYFAKDPIGRFHAALYLIWDAETAYCWQLGADTKLRKSGAVQLLIWHSIQEAIKMEKGYNFEGSMLPHIEPVFRAFGAERKQVFQIRKSSNRFFEVLRILFQG